LIREKLIEKGMGFDKDFRMRGTGEVSRIEALSDAVFGFTGLAYWLIGPVQFVSGMMMGKRRKRMEQLMEAEASATASE
jgi:hypothetical protein